MKTISLKRREMCQETRREKLGPARSLLIVAGFLCLGLLSACSGVRSEIIQSKQASSESREKIYGQNSDSRSNGSLWSIDYKQVN